MRDETENAAPVVSDEEAADFARLQAAADEQAAELAPEPEQLGPDPVAETAAMIQTAVALLSPLLPYLPGIYTEEKIGQLAGAYVPVAEKYGWSSGGWFDRFGAEIVLAATVLPVAAQTKAAHEAWAAERAAKEKAERAKAGWRSPEESLVRAKAAQEEGPGSREIQFGTAAPVAEVVPA